MAPGPPPLTWDLFSNGEESHRCLSSFPMVTIFLFWAGNFEHTQNDPVSGVFESSLSAKEKKLATRANSNAAYSSGNLLYADDKGQLIAAPFELPTAIWRHSGNDRPQPILA